MTVFELDKQEQGDWFSFFNSHFDRKTGEVIYDEAEEGAAEFRVRSLAPFLEERRKDRKKQFAMVLNPSTRAMERVGYYDDLPQKEASREADDAWDYAITGFKNAFSAPGVEMECTKENKLKLIEIPAFLRFITRAFQMISDAGIAQKESAEKN